MVSRMVSLSPRFYLTCLAVALLMPGWAQSEDRLLRRVIDRETQAVWADQKIAPPGRATDTVFLRRVYLDLVGMIPAYDETVAFLADNHPSKRELLIDKLLADPRHARQQAQVWDILLLGRSPNNIGHPNNRTRFRQWLGDQFQNNVPYDRFVQKLLTAEEDGSQLFYVVHRDADELAAATMRIFLGRQLQCAKCHNHPFEPWTQRDYYGMAGFFVRTYVKEGEQQDHVTRFFVAEKSTGDVSFTVVPKDAPPGFKGTPVKPKFLDGEELHEPALPQDFKEPESKGKTAPPPPLFSRRQKVVDWITSRENPFLAQAVVNRVWAQLLGRGLVHPADDFHSANAPSHPALLRVMQAEFVEHGFDLKWLIREMANSNAYQAEDTGAVEDAMPKFYERARVRPLSAEEWLASLHLATGLGIESAVKSAPSGDMLKYLGQPTDGQGAFQGSLSEHLFLHNGDGFRGLCHPRNGNLPEQLVKSEEGWEAKVERMFLSILSRPPTAVERQQFVQYLNPEPSDAKVRSQRMEEAFWVLVTCSEFRFNR
ncbi:MAG: hypothetical protein RLY70_3696 [Planctomycetota bacterium]